MEKLTFATPDAWGSVKGFGCATLGFANTREETADYETRLEGTAFSGTYEEILKKAETIEFAQAAIVVFGNAGGENQFLKDLQKIVNCPMVGGGAAFSKEPGQIPGGKEAAVFFIQDDRYTFQTETRCIHETVVEECQLTLEDKRTILAINGRDAKTYLDEKKRALGLSAEDFEHLTLTDRKGVNAHLSFADGKIKSGRDLEETMVLRYVPHDAVYSRIREFYDDENAIIFGCAGLGGILDAPLNTKNLGLFLFGEVCTVAGVAEFGNLMLSKLRILPKN